MGETIQSLIEQLKCDDPIARGNALDSLGGLYFEDAVNIIAPLLHDPVADVRGCAAFALGEIQDARALPFLLEYLDRETNERERGDAFWALRSYPEPAALKYLVAEVKKPKLSRLPRQYVAEVLRYFDSETAVDTLLFLYNDDDAFVIDYALEGLLILNRPRLKAFWESVVTRWWGSRRDMAKQALSQLQVTGCQSPALVAGD